MNTKFFTFAKPFFNYIDNGMLFKKPFHWLYTLFAFMNLIIPIIVLSKMIEWGSFEYGPIISILMLIILAFSSWISFQLWWDRRNGLLNTSSEGDEFVATPVFAHFLQTFGEWLGVNIAIGGFGMALIAAIMDTYSPLTELVDLPESVFLFGPIYGFFIVVSFRFLAEQFRALASIANNTKN